VSQPPELPSRATVGRPAATLQSARPRLVASLLSVRNWQQLGKFCVNCHAPMAVHENMTTDGLNLDQLPPKLHGITCFFCHSVESVEGTHDDPLKLATILRGELP